MKRRVVVTGLGVVHSLGMDVETFWNALKEGKSGIKTVTKFDTTKAYGLRGISYWALGYPYPENWALLEDNFTVRRLLG